MKAIRILFLAIIVIFVVIQFFPKKVPVNLPVDVNDISNSTIMTADVMAILKRSCYDCHSNQTQFPWYSKMAPVSWFLANHIKEGRDNLNLSEWETLSKRKKIGILDDIGEQVKSGDMPLKSYLLIHRNSRLSDADITLLNNWTEEAAGKVMQ